MYDKTIYDNASEVIPFSDYIYIFLRNFNFQLTVNLQIYAALIMMPFLYYFFNAIAVIILFF